MTDTKWEAVEPSVLRPGDRIRLTHDNGDIIHGEAASVRAYDIHCMHFNGIAEALIADGYRFERAVPERTLPTGWGVFASRAEVDRAGENRLHFDVWMHDEDGWKNLYTNPDVAVTEDAVPADMEPLGLATEADELRARIEKVRDLVLASPTLANAERTAFYAAFEGEPTDV